MFAFFKDKLEARKSLKDFSRTSAKIQGLFKIVRTLPSPFSVLRTAAFAKSRFPWVSFAKAVSGYSDNGVLFVVRNGRSKCHCWEVQLDKWVGEQVFFN